MNSFVWIRQKLAKNKIYIRDGISTQDQNGLQSSQRHTIHYTGPSVPIL